MQVKKGRGGGCRGRGAGGASSVISPKAQHRSATRAGVGGDSPLAEGAPEGAVGACNHYERQGSGPNATKACWAWCDGTMSQAKAHASLLSIRAPS